MQHDTTTKGLVKHDIATKGLVTHDIATKGLTIHDTATKSLAHMTHDYYEPTQLQNMVALNFSRFGYTV